MSSPASKSSLYSVPGDWPGNWKVSESITGDTTIEEFETLRRSYPNHQLNHGAGSGFTVIAAAVEKNNNKLLLYIISIAEQTLINIRDIEGQTPLYYATKQKNYEAAKNLIHHKADVNIATKQWSTPLRMAAEKNDLPTVFLLLKNGALLPTCPEAPPLSSKAKQFIELAQTQLQSSRARFLTVKLATIDNGTTPTQFPLVLLALIADYADFHDEWAAAFNDKDPFSMSSPPAPSTPWPWVNRCIAWGKSVLGKESHQELRQ